MFNQRAFCCEVPDKLGMRSGQFLPGRLIIWVGCSLEALDVRTEVEPLATDQDLDWEGERFEKQLVACDDALLLILCLEREVRTLDLDDRAVLPALVVGARGKAD